MFGRLAGRLRSFEETQLRQRNPRCNGVYAGKGWPASIDATRVREMKAQGLAASPSP
jgi:hypothetical protein